MRTCETCGTRVYLGRARFCSEECRTTGFDATIAQRIPPQVAMDRALAIHAGQCPCCSGPGPVDLHFSYRGWSALFVSAWESRSRISCRRCGARQQLQAIIYTLLLGWWSIPGILMTIVQVSRNLAALSHPPDPSIPTRGFVARVRVQLGAQPLI